MARASHEEATEESALSDMMNTLPPPPSPPSSQPVRTYELPIRDSQAHTAAQGNHMGRMEHTTQAFGAEEGRRAPSSIPSDPPRGGQRAPRRPTHQTPAELVDPFWNPYYESLRYGQRTRTWPERRIISILNGWHLEGERDDENKIRLLEEALGAVPAAGVPPSEARESFKEIVNQYRQKFQHEQAEMLMEKKRRDELRSYRRSEEARCDRKDYHFRDRPENSEPDEEQGIDWSRESERNSPSPRTAARIAELENERKARAQKAATEHEGGEL